jgi:hypothetical protein
MIELRIVREMNLKVPHALLYRAADLSAERLLRSDFEISAERQELANSGCLQG